MYCDPQGGQHFYEGLYSHQVASYHTSYLDTFNQALLISTGLSAVVAGIAMITPVKATRAMFWSSLALLYGNLKEHASLAYNYAFPGEEDDKNVFSILVTSEKGISPLLIHQVFYAGPPMRFFYRISAFGFITSGEKSPDNQDAPTIYQALPFSSSASRFDESNPLVNRLVTALRKRNVYMELEVLYSDDDGQHNVFSNEFLSGFEGQQRLVRVIFYSQEQSWQPKIVTFTAPDGMDWIESLLSTHFYNSYIMSRYDGLSRFENTPEAHSAADAGWAGMANKKFDSPLSPDWLQHIVDWLEYEPHWTFPANDSAGSRIQAGPGYRRECDAEGGCTSRYLSPEPDENGCLTLELDGLTYYLPGNLANPFVTAQPPGNYCHALLPESTGLFARKTYSSSNLKNNHRKLYFDKLGKDLTVMGMIVLFGNVVRLIVQQPARGGPETQPLPLPGTESTFPVPASSVPVVSTVVPTVTTSQAPTTSAVRPVVIPPIYYTTRRPCFVPADISEYVDVSSLVTARRLTVRQMSARAALQLKTKAEGTGRVETLTPDNVKEKATVVQEVVIVEKDGEAVSPELSLASSTESLEMGSTPSLDDILVALENESSEASNSEDMMLSFSQDDTASSVSILSLSTLTMPVTETVGDLTYKIHQLRTRKQFTPGAGDIDVKKFRNRGRKEAAEMTVVGHLVNRGWEAATTDTKLEALGWEELVDNVIRPEFSRLGIKHLPPDSEMKNLHRIYSNAIRFHPGSFTGAARHIMIQLVVNSKTLEKFEADREVFTGFSDSATARIVAAIVSLNSLEEEPFGSYRSFLTGTIKRMRMFSPIEQINIIASNQELFSLVDQYVHERRGMDIIDYELKSIALGSWPQSRDHLETELREVERRKAKAIRMGVDKELEILARNEFSRIKQEGGIECTETDIDESSDEYQALLERLKPVNEQQVRGELMDKLDKEVELGEARYGVLQQNMAHALRYFPETIEILKEIQNSLQGTRIDAFAQLESDLDSDVRLMMRLMKGTYKEMLIKYIWKHNLGLLGKFDFNEQEARHILEKYRDVQLTSRHAEFKRQRPTIKARQLAGLLDTRETERADMEVSRDFDLISLRAMMSYFDLSGTTDEEHAFAVQFLQHSPALDSLKLCLETFIYAEKFDIEDLVLQAQNLFEEVKGRIQVVRQYKDRMEARSQKEQTPEDGVQRESRLHKSMRKLYKVKEELGDDSGLEGKVSSSDREKKVKKGSGEYKVHQASLRGILEQDKKNAVEKNVVLVGETVEQHQQGPVAGIKQSISLTTELNPAAVYAAERVRIDQDWKKTIRMLMKRYTRNALLSTMDPEWYQHNVPKAKAKAKQSDTPKKSKLIHPDWSREEMELAQRLEVILREKVDTRKGKDSDKTVKRLLPSTMQLTTRINVVRSMIPGILKQVLIPLQELGHIQLEEGETIDLSLMILDKDNPVSVWYHQQVAEVVAEEMNYMMQIVGKMREQFIINRPQAAVSEDFGVKPLEDIVSGSGEKAFVMSRLASVEYVAEQVLPWMVKAGLLTNEYGLWALTDAGGTFIRKTFDQEQYRQFMERAKQMIAKADFHRYKMPEARWREVSGLLMEVGNIVRKYYENEARWQQELSARSRAQSVSVTDISHGMQNEDGK